LLRGVLSRLGPTALEMGARKRRAFLWEAFTGEKAEEAEETVAAMNQEHLTEGGESAFRLAFRGWTTSCELTRDGYIWLRRSPARERLEGH